MTTLAMLGAGTMGAPMARNLARAGFSVRAWNRTRDRAKALEAEGVTVAGTPTEAVRDADVIVTMLYDAASVIDTMLPALPEVGQDSLWLQMTTIGPEGAQRLQHLADEFSVPMVDAPVVGTRTPAEQGSLTVLAAGPHGVRDRAATVFDVVGNRTVWVEAPQGGQRLKLVANSWVLTVTEAVAEALRLAAGLGLDPALFAEAIAGTASDLPYARAKAQEIRAKDFTPNFSVGNALKDARLILDAGATANVDVGLTEVVRRHLQRASDMGYGGRDIAAMALA